MLLRQESEFNDLSPELRKKIEDRVRGYGKSVRYKFEISNENPDPEKKNGKFLWPGMYTLDPAVFYINDPYEKREGKSKSKRIGMIDTTKIEQGRTVVERFRKIKVEGKFFGILKLELQEIDEHFDYACYLELHPKYTGGDFADKSKRQVFKRIDELAAATKSRAERTERQKASDAAQGMTKKELIDFADAMSGGNNIQWDSTQEEVILRNQVEELAETDPVFFNTLTTGKNIEYQALVKQALNRDIILFDPSEYSFVYAGNKHPIIVLSPNGEQNEIEKMATWLQTGGKEAHKKIKSLVESK